MFEQEVRLLLGATPAEIMSLMNSILNLIEQLVFNHNWQSNTNLAAIAEAQGAEIVRSNGITANHAQALREGLRALINAETVVKNNVDRINNPQIGNTIREVLRPLFDFSRNARQVGNNTLGSLNEVAQLNPRRLEGVQIITGERGRASSVVQQIANQAVSLRQRGIDPKLVQNSTPFIRTVIAEAEALPAEEREAVIKITPVLVAMRQLIAIQLRIASGVARAALSRFLGPLEAMLSFLAKAFGGRLTSFILIPKFLFDQMLESAGISGSRA
jgi:hypothetical protein